MSVHVTTLHQCRTGDHDRCAARVFSPPNDRGRANEIICDCPCHAKETAGLDMKQAFGR